MRIVQTPFTYFFWPVVLFVLFEALFLSLATWQHQRLHEKQQHIAAEKRTKALPPVTLLNQKNVGRRIILRGTWQPAGSIVLLHQPHHSLSGRRLFSPLETENGVVLVDRGWQMRRKNQDFPDLAPQAVTVEGVIRPFPQRKGWLGGPAYNRNPRELLFLDPDVIQADIQPDVYVEALQTTHPAFEPVPQQQAVPPRRHAEYRNTWLACAVALALMFTYFVLRRARAFRSKMPSH